MAHPSYKKPCVDFGITEDSKPCDKYSPNPSTVKLASEKNVVKLANVITDLSDEDTLTLATILNQEARTRRQGFRFGQKVYFRIYGGEYLRNYVVARVVSADSKYVYLQGTDGYVASLHHQSVLSEKQWLRKEFELLKTNKINDPSRARYEKVPTKAQLELQKMEKPMPLDLSAALNGKGFLSSSQPEKKKTTGRSIPLSGFLTVR
jgi:hypothetical protein